MSKWKKRLRDRRKTEESKLVEGRITITAGGFGFVTPTEGGPDIFIPPRQLGDAIDSDLVQVSIIKEERRGIPSGKGPVGTVKNIVDRKRKTLVGELIAGRKVRPLCKKIQEDISINGSLDLAKGLFIAFWNHQRNRIFGFSPVDGLGFKYMRK